MKNKVLWITHKKLQGAKSLEEHQREFVENERKDCY